MGSLEATYAFATWSSNPLLGVYPEDSTIQIYICTIIYYTIVCNCKTLQTAKCPT